MYPIRKGQFMTLAFSPVFQFNSTTREFTIFDTYGRSIDTPGRELWEINSFVKYPVDVVDQIIRLLDRLTPTDRMHADMVVLGPDEAAMLCLAGALGLLSFVQARITPQHITLPGFTLRGQDLTIRFLPDRQTGIAIANSEGVILPSGRQHS